MPSDAEIYLLVEATNKQWCWYSISKGHPGLPEMQQDHCGICVAHRSGTQHDIVRKMQIPQLDLYRTAGQITLRGASLVVLEEKLCLICGCEGDRGCTTIPGYYYYDMRLSYGFWHNAGKFRGGNQFGGAIVSPSGVVYTSGKDIHRFKPCFLKSFGMEEKLDLLEGAQGNYRILGCTTDDVYFYSYKTEENGSNSLLLFNPPHYNMEEHDKLWHVLLSDNFWGEWSPGVVLYLGHYLFSFGTQNPTKNPEEGEVGLPGIYAFGRTTGKWLDQPVMDLPNDGMVLPDVEATQRFYTRSLYLVKKNYRGFKLALVWTRTYSNPDSNPPQHGVEVHWSKFRLNATVVDRNLLEFNAVSLSTVVCRLEGTISLLNTAVACSPVGVY